MLGGRGGLDLKPPQGGFISLGVWIHPLVIRSKWGGLERSGTSDGVLLSVNI